jgi:ribosomal protein S18 acetylase RimI-like enzyme
MPLALRPLVAGDLEVISQIHADACRVAYRFMNWDYSLDAVRQWYQAEKLPAWDWGSIAEDAGAAVAFVAMIGGHIDQLFVRPENQTQGIGRALLDAALSRGIRPATLNVFEDNLPARRFYDRYGFVEVRRWLNEQDRAVELLYQLG